MASSHIRPLAICVFRYKEHILVSEGYDSVKRQLFYRPLGGGIEFGEYGRDTIVREIREEISTEVTNIHYLGMCENIFTYQGAIGHEIVLIYDGEFVNASFYECEHIDGIEDDLGPFTAMWKPLHYFKERHAPLYPDGLLELLTAQQ